MNLPAAIPKTFPLSWNPAAEPSPAAEPWAVSRASPDAPPITCLWSAGFIANRAELLSLTGLAAETPAPELLVHRFRQAGPRVAEEICGAFAWVLWDGVRRRLIAARDRLGLHGLYYAVKGETFCLADRAAVVLEALSLPARRNEHSLLLHLHGQAPAVGETFHEGVRAVEPGGLVTVGAEGVRPERYWRLVPRRTLRLASDDEYADAWRELLGRVVKETAPRGRLGIALSGGLDSPSVAAALHESGRSSDLVALCWRAPELPDADESRFALAVARRLRLEVETLRADRCWPLSDPTGLETPRDTPYRIFYRELWRETYRLARKKGLRVLLSGSSGDHLFGGWSAWVYPDLLLTGRWLEMARQIRDHLPHSRLSFRQVICHHLLRPLVAAYLPRWRPAGRVAVPWIRRRHRRTYRDLRLAEERQRLLLPGRQQRLEMLGDRSLPQTMMQADRLAAREGIEVRHPLLDHRLFELAAALPTSQTFRAGQRKIIMRHAMQGRLPDSVVSMWGKIEPTAIFDRGMRREQAKVRPLLEGMRAADLGLVDEGRLRQAFEAYLEGSGDSRFFFAVTLEDWLRRYS